MQQGRNERRVEKRGEPEDSPGLSSAELLLKRVREGSKGVISTSRMTLSVRSPGPPGWAGLYIKGYPRTKSHHG